MKVNEDLSILFWLNRQKGSKDGLVPIWVRITFNVAKTRVELEKHYNQLAAVHKRVTAAMVKEAYVPKQVLQKSLVQAFKLHNDEFDERVSKNKGSDGTLSTL